MARRCAGCSLHFPGMDCLYPKETTTYKPRHTQEGPLSLLWKKGLMLSLHLLWVEGHEILQNMCLVLAHCWGMPTNPFQNVQCSQTRCRKGRSHKGGHHELCLQAGQQRQTWKHFVADLPSSLENIQKYVTSKFNQEICGEATDIFPRCFVSVMEENLEEELRMLTHIHMQAHGYLFFNSCNSLLLLFCAARAFVGLG